MLRTESLLYSHDSNRKHSAYHYLLQIPWPALVFAQSIAILAWTVLGNIPLLSSTYALHAIAPRRHAPIPCYSGPRHHTEPLHDQANLLCENQAQRRKAAAYYHGRRKGNRVKILRIIMDPQLRMLYMSTMKSRMDYAASVLRKPGQQGNALISRMLGQVQWWERGLSHLHFEWFPHQSWKLKPACCQPTLACGLNFCNTPLTFILS